MDSSQFTEKEAKNTKEIVNLKEATSSLIMLFATLDIHYDNVLITEMQKQNET